MRVLVATPAKVGSASFLNSLEERHDVVHFHSLDILEQRIGPVKKVVAQKGKLIIDTVQREFKMGHKEINRIKKEFVKILKKGGV